MEGIKTEKDSSSEEGELKSDQEVDIYGDEKAEELPSNVPSNEVDEEWNLSLSSLRKSDAKKGEEQQKKPTGSIPSLLPTSTYPPHSYNPNRSIRYEPWRSRRDFERRPYYREDRRNRYQGRQDRDRKE